MSLTESFGQDVRPWLKLVEDLRALDLDAELNIPQICVMGDQSSGKSSVLEALSGIPFPRGSGLVTRCPIRLVMRKARRDESWIASVFTSIEPLKRVTVTDVSQLCGVIDKLTSSLCHGSNNFSMESISIELVSPDACDLTVVDLPGIIRTVTAGQSSSTIDQVNKLIKSFLVDKRTIILAVIPANQVFVYLSAGY
jgi:interferon-induced GTP-binding protein Mx